MNVRTLAAFLKSLGCSNTWLSRTRRGLDSWFINYTVQLNFAVLYIPSVETVKFGIGKKASHVSTLYLSHPLIVVTLRHYRSKQALRTETFTHAIRVRVLVGELYNPHEFLQGFPLFHSVQKWSLTASKRRVTCLLCDHRIHSLLWLEFLKGSLAHILNRKVRRDANTIKAYGFFIECSAVAKAVELWFI